MVLPHSYEKLRNWNSGSSLGTLITEFIKLLHTKPPVPIPTHTSTSLLTSQSLPSVARKNPPQVATLQSSNSSPQPTLSQLPTQSLTPSIPDRFDEIEQLTDEEITSLLEDERELNCFFLSLKAVQNMRQLCDDLRQSNAETATQTLATLSTIESLQSQATEQQEQLKLAIAEYEEKAKEYRELQMKYTPSALLHQLTQCVNEAETKTDQLTSSLLAGEMNVDEYIRIFIQEREKYHSLAARHESLHLSLQNTLL
jgi:hypothetical protein